MLRTRVTEINGMTRSEQTGCEVRTWYLFLSHLWAHWVTVLSPDMCVMDSEGLWLAGCDPLTASYWLMGDKIEVTAVISPCPHHGIPNEQNRIKELKFSREYIMVASVCISALKVASWHHPSRFLKSYPVIKTFSILLQDPLFCKCKNLIYAIRGNK